MELAKKLLYGILGVLTLISVLILACAFKPELADKVSDFIYAEKDKDNSNANDYSDTDSNTDDNAVDSNVVNHKDGQTKGTGLTSDEVLRTPQPPEGYALHTDTSSVNAPNGHTQREKLNVPEGVEGRGGYVPVQDQSEQLDDEAVKKLQEQYTYGETGEGLDFDTEYYPYYGMLDEDGQSLYRQIYANADGVNGIFNPVVQVSREKLKNVFMAVFNDHPELFWLDSAYRGRFDSNGKCVEIVLQFNSLVDNLDEAKNEFYAAAEEILTGADKQTSDYDVELFIHDSLMNRITYDLGSAYNQSAYSGLVNGRTVCAGYARAFQYLMMQMGIPCYYCTGYAGENHAWNIVKLDGDFYNADVTWDDTEPNTYNFFNKTDGDYRNTHIREDMSVNLPACNGTKYGGLETNPSDNTDVAYAGERTLEDTGFTKEQVLTGLEDYYNDCYRQLMEKGGSCQFDNVVDSENLWLKCYDAYNCDFYSAGYMNKVLSKLGKQGCEVDIEAEPLRDGEYILHHSIQFF